MKNSDPLIFLLPSLLLLALAGGCANTNFVDRQGGGLAEETTSDRSGNQQSPRSDLSPNSTAEITPSHSFGYLDSKTNNLTKDQDRLKSGTETEDDLWSRLRAGFNLVYSNPKDQSIPKYESWYSKHPKYFSRLSGRAYWFLPYVLNEVEKRGMPMEIAILPALESAFRLDAVSSAKAVGLWQFIAPTGQRFGLRQNWWMDSRRDLIHSTRAALDYLSFLANEFDNDWELALAAYNAGEGAVQRAIKRNLRAGKPTGYPYLRLPRETKEYVPRLFAIRNIISNPEKFGIALQPIPDEQTIAVVDARIQTDITIAASIIPAVRQELLMLNRGYLRGVTPPSGPHNLVVPIQYTHKLKQGLDNLTYQQRLRWVSHQVRKGDYLYRIAKKYNTTIPLIKGVNQLKSNTIHPGRILKIPINQSAIQYAKASVSDVVVIDGKWIYTVRRGDSLSKIAQLHGTSLSALLKWNSISIHEFIQPGQKLIVWYLPS